MNRCDPSSFLGKYFVPYPPVVSVFASPGGQPPRRVRRRWPFLIVEVTKPGFKAVNTTTGHIMEVLMSEILACIGEDGLPPNYFRPLTLHLRSQICWDSLNLWCEPLPGHKRRPRRRGRYTIH